MAAQTGRGQATMLDVRDLVVRYGDVTAVDRVSLTARAGEVVGLLGPNGAGKTSVIRALTTVVPTAGGTAEVAGHPLGRSAAVRAAIGVLPESNGYPGGVTASRYLRYYGQLFGLSRGESDARAGELLDRVDLTARRPIATFSRGMRQRLGLARALVNRPTVLFLDEPTLGLDPAGKASMLGHLSTIAEQDGVCVVVCTHLLDEVERICHRLVIVHHGRVVADGSVAQIVAAAGIGDRLRIRVALDQADAARDVLARAGHAEVGSVAQSGDCLLEVPARRGDLGTADLLRSLLDAGIVPVAFDIGAAGLSDAFLALTRESGAAR